TMVITSALTFCEDVMVNEPCDPVSVADLPPLTCTVAPAIGCLSELLKTRPVIEVWAKRLKLRKRSNAVFSPARSLNLVGISNSSFGLTMINYNQIYDFLNPDLIFF